MWLRTNRLTTVENYVNIYRNDDEPLGFLLLPHTDGDLTEARVADRILVASIPPAQLESGIEYLIEVRVAGDNLPVKPFRFRVRWDGTLAGFKKCANAVG